MSLPPKITPEEYEALKRVVAEFDAIERDHGVHWRDHRLEAFREIDEQRAVMRAAIEGYEASHQEEE
jgi:hypothetical protein